MKLRPQDKIYEHIYVAGNPFYPAYVIKGNKKSLMIDSGVNLFGPQYLTSLQQILDDDRALDYLFITHSHYDHLGATPYLLKKIPDLKIGGLGTITDLLKKESVLNTMNRFSDIQKQIFTNIAVDEDITISPFEITMPLKEGDTIDLGGITCQVFETPGHTRDCLSYYIPELKALFAGEAIGVPDGREGKVIQVEFLSSHKDYVSSIEKLNKLDIDIIGMAHGWVFTGEDASDFLSKSLDETEQYRKMIEKILISTDKNIQEAIDTIVKIEYDEKGLIFQEKNAYIANLTAQVKHIAGLM